jgi:hypothetical protein
MSSELDVWVLSVGWWYVRWASSGHQVRQAEPRMCLLRQNLSVFRVKSSLTWDCKAHKDSGYVCFDLHYLLSTISSQWVCKAHLCMREYYFPQCVHRKICSWSHTRIFWAVTIAWIIIWSIRDSIAWYSDPSKPPSNHSMAVCFDCIQMQLHLSFYLILHWWLFKCPLFTCL